MRAVLHILTRAEDPLPAKIIRHQQGLPEHRIEVVDLTVPAPDYEALLEKIFAADSVSVW